MDRVGWDQAAASIDPRILLITIDRASSVVTLLRSDGMEGTLSLGTNPFEPTSGVQSMTYSPSANLIYIQTTKGDRVAAELPTPTDQAPRRGRPVVYLDQKDWSTIAKTIHAPARVPLSSQREAATALIDLALNGRVILPMSSAHMSETCKWTDNEARYQLALTIVQLSAGWQMRDPLEVRRRELRESFLRLYKSACLLPVPVITLEANATNGTRALATRPPRGGDLPPSMSFVLDALTSAMGNLDTMLDGVHVPMDAVPGWVTDQEDFNRSLATSSIDSQQKRKIINGFFLRDTTKELAEEAAASKLTPSDMHDWCQKRSDAELSAMPALGLFREVLREKHLNPGTRWTQNDLTDMMYLTCGAAYADFMVCESSLSSAMRNGLKRLGRPDNVLGGLADVVAKLT